MAAAPPPARPANRWMTRRCCAGSGRVINGRLRCCAAGPGSRFTAPSPCSSAIRPTLAGWAVAMARAVRQLPGRASMSNSHPERYTTTYVHVSTVKYAKVTTIAHYKSGRRQRSGTASARGRASIPYHIGGATPGYRVNVSVAVTSGTRQGHCAASFTPQRAQFPGQQRTHPGGAAPNSPRTRGRYLAGPGRVPGKRTPGLAAACRPIASRPTRRSGDDR
jgi:hypothetical protein